MSLESLASLYQCFLWMQALMHLFACSRLFFLFWWEPISYEVCALRVVLPNSVLVIVVLIRFVCGRQIYPHVISTLRHPLIVQGSRRSGRTSKSSSMMSLRYIRKAPLGSFIHHARPRASVPGLKNDAERTPNQPNRPNLRPLRNRFVVRTHDTLCESKGVRNRDTDPEGV
jgi:hypothetical protein